MNKVSGDLSVEEYVALKLTCGHTVCLDRYSGPEDESVIPTPGEVLIYCIRCGHDAQVARILNKERIIQVVTCWNYTRQYIARDNDAKREALRVRETDDEHARTERLPDSSGDSGVSRDEGAVDFTEGAKAGGDAAGEDQSGDVLASPGSQ